MRNNQNAARVARARPPASARPPRRRPPRAPRLGLRPTRARPGSPGLSRASREVVWAAVAQPPSALRPRVTDGTEVPCRQLPTPSVRGPVWRRGAWRGLARGAASPTLVFHRQHCAERCLLVSRCLSADSSPKPCGAPLACCRCGVPAEPQSRPYWQRDAGLCPGSARRGRQDSAPAQCSLPTSLLADWQWKRREEAFARNFASHALAARSGRRPGSRPQESRVEQCSTEQDGSHPNVSFNCSAGGWPGLWTRVSDSPRQHKKN